MLKQWSLHRFKSLARETVVDLSPLTIFAGSNSSGKSSLLQSVLLIAQTVSGRIPSRSLILNGHLVRLGLFPDVRTDGEEGTVKIGWVWAPTYNPTENRGQLMAGVRLRTTGGTSVRALSCSLEFSDSSPSWSDQTTPSRPRLVSFSCKTTIQKGRYMEGRPPDRMVPASPAVPAVVDLQLGAVSLDGEQPQGLLDHAIPGTVGRPELLLDAASGDFVVFNNCLPVSLVRRRRRAEGTDKVVLLAFHVGLFETPEAEEELTLISNLHPDATRVPLLGLHIFSDEDSCPDPVRRVMKEMMDGDLSAKDEVSVGEFIAHLRRNKARLKLAPKPLSRQDNENFVNFVARATTEQFPEEEFVDASLERGIKEGVDQLRSFFSTSVHYLGPLRNDPQALYPILPSADPDDVGLKGELTAAVLEMNGSQIIDYFPPEGFEPIFIEPKALQEENRPRRETPTKSSLSNAVRAWLQYLDVAQDVISKDRGKLGHEIEVLLKGQRKPHDLTHVGVGVSQVLPILVMGLLAPRGATLIFEQPELHLHPKVQTRLADFFLALTQAGKQCLVETHSEYLVSRLRRRIAASGASSDVPQDVKVYFAEMGSDGSRFREVSINEYGAIEDWPDGFFDQAQTEAEAIIHAASVKRRLSREKK